MSINELPEDCLLIIFDLINELDDLLNCYKVCNKWSQLIAERTRKVKYLFEYYERRKDDGFPRYQFDYVYYRTVKPIDATCLSTLFPNLMIADFSFTFCENLNLEDIVTLIKKMKSLKGLIHDFYQREEAIFQYCNALEMVSTNFIQPCMEKKGVDIKQLHLWNEGFDSFMEKAHYFPNLERLYLDSEEGPRYYYNGPIFERLKIVELCTIDRIWLEFYDDPRFYGFQFMDSCPNLKSAKIYLDNDQIFIDETLKHESLQDLVIQFDDPDFLRFVGWDELKRLFMKYPNLKHLALRSFKHLENEHVKHLVRNLPNLVLFDVRGCPRVTQEAANYIQYYNRRHGRTIKFYFDGNYREIQSDWPHLSSKPEKISQGFDFMKHCFLGSSPTFLISTDKD